MNIMPATQPSVEHLISLLETNTDLQAALSTAIKKANQEGIKTLDDFYDFINGLQTHIPNDKQLNPATEKFWYILNESPDDLLKTSDLFNEWLRDFMMSMGTYMDSTESAR